MRVFNGHYDEDNESGLPKAYDTLKEAKEPCVHLKLIAHGSHPTERTGNELDEALLIPVSVLEKLVAMADEDYRKLYGIGKMDISDRWFSSEAEPGSDRWVLEIPEYEKVDGGWLRGGPIYFSPEELAGNPERAQFRDLLRVKLQQLGDSLMQKWEEKNKEAGGD